jgi:hypothetical protein
MIRLIICLLVSLVITVGFTDCSAAKKSTSEKRGLMLLENTQLGRNRSYYSKRDVKKIEKKHKKHHHAIKNK